ncbi:MAG TPA: hypothetical protein PLO89_03655, partial [Spirochaetota bacterium]|nr:hypothetical protein [Spirochaetota bacterium]
MSKRIISTLIVFSFFLMFSCTEPVLIIPSKSDNSYLSSITVDGAQIENFSSDNTSYYIKTANNRIVIDGTKVNQNASVTGFGARDLVLGKNRITISVYSESDKMSTFYYLYVYHYNDSSAYLTDLKIDGDSINDFASDKYVYNRRIEKNVSTLIEAIPANPGSIVTGAGEIKLDISSDTINLKISVTSKDASSTLEYTIIFNRSGFTGFYNVTDLSYEFQKDGYKTVIFGDSLSVGYGFFNG